MIDIQPDILTSKEVCELLKISPVTLWRERRAGRITYRKVSSKVIFLRDDVLEYLERVMQPARIPSGR
jgi:excisionase family DNA binding protein